MLRKIGNDIHNLPPHSKTTKKLVTKRLGLSNSAKSSIVNLFCIQFHAVLWELESLLNNGCQLPNPSPFLTYINPRSTPKIKNIFPVNIVTSFLKTTKQLTIINLKSYRKLSIPEKENQITRKNSREPKTSTHQEHSVFELL